MNKAYMEYLSGKQGQQEASTAGTLSYEQELIDAISVPLFFLDLSGNFVGSNEAFTRFVGKSDEEGAAVGCLQPAGR